MYSMLYTRDVVGRIAVKGASVSRCRRRLVENALRECSTCQEPSFVL